MRNGKWLRRLMVAALLVGALVVVNAQQPSVQDVMTRADKLFEQKNYKEAADLYQAALQQKPDGAQLTHGFEHLMICQLRLSLFDDALKSADQFVERTKGTWLEARARRQAGNLYMLVPHWGTRSGGVFYRAEGRQGIRLRSERHDKGLAVGHLERARDLYAVFDAAAAAGDDPLPADVRKGWHDERIECTFDLANCVSRFTIYENDARWWWFAWADRDDLIAETAGEQDFDEFYSDWERQRRRPIGLRADDQGNPIFPVAPDAYAPTLSDDQKILFLLGEARGLDKSKEGRFAALSYYRQAMLARTRFGMDRINNYAGMYWWAGKAPLQEELGNFNPWDLKDDETLALVAGRVRRIALPDEFNVLKLLRTVDDYPKSGVADQARYAVGLYYQSRQQYDSALREYEALKKAFAQSAWVASADEQVARILAPQVQMGDNGVQLPGEPAALQVSYRNVRTVHFVARSFNHKAFLEEMRDAIVKDPEKQRFAWSIASWSSILMSPGNPQNPDQWIREAAARQVGAEVARWTREVPDDGSHRYAQATLPTPLKDAGAYLVYAYVAEPPKEQAQTTGVALFALGDSRAVLVLSDLGIVEKKTAKGSLYYICDARSGAPVPQAKVDVLEMWSVYERQERRTRFYSRMHNLTADADGLALFAPSYQGSRQHLLVSAPGDRLAWSGMTYAQRYNPSMMREGMLAYVITDRPVYRPGQTVRYKVWVRRMQNGNLVNLPTTAVQVRIHDARGNKLSEEQVQTDQFGGLDGRLTLGEEPPLGVYQIAVVGAGYVGGQTFRVEEYKKPEFEVTVEPSAAHAKLGGKLTAQIRAKYYFGGPVTEATVSYKVFREEYRQSYYFPGAWDWLYGPGYGCVWYDYDWFPWWGQVRCCRVPPPWWWRQPAPPIRELVKEGEGPIGPDGTLKVEIDTAPALREHGDLDHRYVVQADVRDASRRVISGEGAVIVTRQAFYAFVQSDRGYYVPGQDMRITVRCQTPDGSPVQTEGVVTVSRIVYGGPDNAHLEETELDRWKAKTDERGDLTFQIRHERSDQLKIAFQAPDAWGGVVAGYGLVWVCGRDFDGRLYRFNDLELITDKRSYQPGEVCHLMVNTKRAGSYVLLSDDVDSNMLLSWRLLHLTGRTTIVDIPITKDHHPNFFVEATTVSDVRVHQQAAQVCVPPEESVLNVTVATDKPQYRPGEKAQITVTARTPDGAPAAAQLVLSVFDKSVLYIQPEYTPEIRKFFHGRLRYHSPQMLTNLLDRFAAVGQVLRPFQHIYPVPPDWNGIWGPSIGDWRTVSPEELQNLAAQGGMGGGYRGRGDALGKDSRTAAMPAEGLAAPAPMAMAKGSEAQADKAEGEAPVQFAEATVRQKFADTALWLTTLVTDKDGKAVATVEMPENLTTWKVNTWAMTAETRVGQQSAEAVTTKNLIVRLQAPRFFLEYDEVVLSANVHNYLPKEKKARVSLEVPEKLLALMAGSPATVDVAVPAGGERRVNWRVKVLLEGKADLTVKALTDEESDAMKMSFPVLVHGMMKQVAKGGSMRPDQAQAVQTAELEVPDRRRPELTRLEVQFSPSLVGAMLDALPYLLDYPYESSDMTVGRIMPAVLTLKTIQNMGVKLEDLKEMRGRLAEVRRIEKGEHVSIYSHVENPIFDTEELNRLIDRSLRRIETMQNGDGGWSWWKGEESTPHMTSYVLNALVTAQQCDLKIDEGMIQRGMNFLKNWEEQQMRNENWQPDAGHAFTCYVLSMGKLRAAIQPAKDDKRPGDCLDRLHEGRDKLNLYGKALLSLAFANVGDGERARLVLNNIMQYKQENAETEIAWFRTPERGGWWYWWNSEIEINTWCLRALLRLEPKSDVAPRVVKWLIENRRNGYYWNSTRDTTLCLAALSDFVVLSGEGRPDYTLTIELDGGKVRKEVKIDKDNFFTFENRFVVDGVALGAGKHTVTVRKAGPGALYWSAYLSYFTKETDIKAAGREIKVERRYYRLQRMPYEVVVEGARGQKLVEKRLRYERVPLRSGDRVESGDLVQVELEVESDNNYTFLAIEDMKAAGCEPVELRSGSQVQEGFRTYTELRDEKAVFFMNDIEAGKHLLRYRLRAEVPGIFHALPTSFYAIYVPELKANSDEMVLEIKDK